MYTQLEHQWEEQRTEYGGEREPCISTRPASDPVAIGTRRCFFRWSNLLHLIAVAMTAGLLWINSSQVYWFSTQVVNGKPIVYGRYPHISTLVVTNLLQFVSKIHEIVMVCSLAAITLEMFRRQLVSQGLPFGLLTGGYRVGDLPYFLNPRGSFWEGFRSDATGGRPKRIALFLLFITILSNVLGPASAILVIPTEDWFPMTNPFRELQMPIYYYYSASDIWPPQVSASDIPECQTWDATHTWYCPAGGFSQIYSWASGFKYTGQNNITFQVPTTALYRQMVVHDPNGSDASIFTSPSSASVLALGRLADFIQNEDSGTVGDVANEPKYQLLTSGHDGASQNSQPIVQVQCSLYDRDDCMTGRVVPHYDSSDIACFGSRPCDASVKSSSAVHPWVYNDTSKYPYDLLTLYLAEDDDYGLVSYGLIPYSENATQSSWGTQGSWVYACAIVAHWAPSTLSVDPVNSGLVESDINLPDLYRSSQRQRLDPVQFTSNWIDTLNPTHNETVVQSDTNTTSEVPIDAITSIVADNFLRYLGTETKNVTYLNIGDGIYGVERLSTTKAANVLRRILGGMVLEGLARSSTNESVFGILYQDKGKTNYTELGLRMGDGLRRLSAVSSTGDAETGDVMVYAEGDAPEQYNETLAKFRNETIAETGMWFDVQVNRWGYGSGQRSPTMYFGMAMMGVYLLIVLVYVICGVSAFIRTHICGPDGGDMRRIVAWGDIEDVLVLALRSATPAVLAPGAKTHTWREKAVVRKDETGQPSLLVRPSPEQEAGTTGLLGAKFYLNNRGWSRI